MIPNLLCLKVATLSFYLIFEIMENSMEGLKHMEESGVDVQHQRLSGLLVAHCHMSGF